MGEVSAIAWTDATFNAWWGCTKVLGKDGRPSACDHCYAADLDHHYHGANDHWEDHPRKLFAEKHWNEPLKWQRKAAAEGNRTRVFAMSMGDIFEYLPLFKSEDGRTLDTERARLWVMIEATPNLDWLLLTKRPQNMNRMAPKSWATGWPHNVIAMATVESEDTVWRIKKILEVPAQRRGLSMEPLFSEVNINPFMPPHQIGQLPGKGWQASAISSTDKIGLDWIITGGESGPHARPGHIDWYRSLRDQANAAGAAFHFKQWGNWIHEFAYNDLPSVGRPKILSSHTWEDGTRSFRFGNKHATGRLLDGREWNEYPTLESL